MEELTEAEVDERLRGLSITGEPQYLRVCDLTTDPRFQRPLNQRRVRQIAAEFDPYAVGMMYVSERIDGTRIILDGQHRKEALVKMGWGDQLAPCYVYRNLELEDEARIFRIMNENRTRPTAIDLFRTKLVERDATAMDIARILSAHGLRVNPGSDRGNFRAINAAMRVYTDGGRDTFQQVISVINRAWPTYEDPWATSSDVISGLGMVLAEYETEINLDRMNTALSKELPSNMVAKAKAIRVTFSGSQATCMAMAIVATYNRGMRSHRVQEWQERPWRRNPYVRRTKDMSISP